MIIISSGFPKSSSTFIFLLLEKMLESSGKKSAQARLRKKFDEGFIHHIGITRAIHLAWLNWRFGSVVIKTHDAPGVGTRMLIALGLAKASYSIRDPRDAALSALDHGKKARLKQQPDASDNIFAQIENMQHVVIGFTMHAVRFSKWMRYKKFLLIRYEDVIENPFAVMQQLNTYYRLQLSDEQLKIVLNGFMQNKESIKNFNKGVISRFGTEMSQQDIALLESKFKIEIQQMGYTLTQL